MRRRRARPVLSVVMPVHNVAAYLPEALDSALSQTLTELEVIAVDDGSTDDCLRILREYERRDHRVRVLSQANAGQGVARNVGVALARGEFLTFLDSDDVVPRDAYATMVAGLRASGSDFSVGNLRRLRHGELHRMIWSRTVHREDRIGTTIEEFPSAMQDIIACNRVFRTAFWRDRVGDFEGGVAYEDHVPMLTAYVRARRFDVLQKVTYHWRIREDLTSTGQQKARLRNLRDRVAVKEQAHELLRAETSEAVYAAWVGRALETDFPPFLPFALTGDAAYRALLAETYRTFLARVTPAALEQVRVAMRVRAHLAAAERWDDLFAADDWLREVQNLPPTAVVDGRLVADFPASCTWSDALPADQRRLAPLESHFEGAVEHLEWSPTALRVTGWAWLRGLDMRSPDVRAWLVQGTERVRVEATQVHLPEADVWGPLSFASPADGGFVVTVEAASLAPGRWSLEVELQQDGLTASGPLHGRVARSAAVRPGSGVVGGLHVAPEWDAAHGLTLHVTPGAAADREGHPVEVAGVDVQDGLVLDLRVPDGAGTAVLSQVGSEATVPVLLGAGDEGVRAVVPLPPSSALPDGTYLLRVDGQVAHAAPSLAERAPHRFFTRGADLQVGQRPDGRAVLVVSPPLRADELGQVNQHRLQERFADAPLLTDAVFLGAGPDQDAMDRWLRDHRPELRRSRDGAPVRGSREWYDAVGGAPFVSLAEDPGPWFTARPGQRRLRTLAGHPYGPVGVSAWRRQGLIEHLVNREVHHLHQQWDVLLAPHEHAVAWLREQFRWEGEVLVAGSPRTDAVVTADRAAVRSRVLGRLGLEDTDGVTVVLHAPAARDEHDVARGGHPGLDLEALDHHVHAGELDRVVVLDVRPPGDRRPSRRPTRRPAGATSVVDASRLDPVDLVVAADVAVLDYSPLRFDWALTGKPALFFVPDLEEWHEHRETAFTWDATAPGPWLRSLEEVLEQLRDPARVSTAYAEATTAFNARFNPLADGYATERVLRAFLAAQGGPAGP